MLKNTPLERNVTVNKGSRSHLLDPDNELRNDTPLLAVHILRLLSMETPKHIFAIDWLYLVYKGKGYRLVSILLC